MVTSGHSENMSDGARRAGAQREEQLAYSASMGAMLDEQARRRKAAKLIAVLRHALGRDGDPTPDSDWTAERPFTGLRALDIGCSAGFIADELAATGAETMGVDIDTEALQKAAARFPRVSFREARATDMPLDDGSVDIVVFNHIYEHVVDPEAVVEEIRRVLSPQGVVYLGLANRLGVIEPHYRLPFLSWLPPGKPADTYLQATRRGEHYYERLRTRSGLRQLFSGLDLWDYTLPVLTEPARFAGDDLVPSWVGRIPQEALALALPLVPTYIWVGFPTPRQPLGKPLQVPARRV